MTGDGHPTKRNGTQTRKRKLLSPDLRKDFVRLRDQMREFAGPLIDLCDSVQVIRDAVVDAQQLADCLIDDDLFGACEVIRRQPRIEVLKDDDGDTDLDCDNRHYRLPVPKKLDHVNGSAPALEGQVLCKQRIFSRNERR